VEFKRKVTMRNTEYALYDKGVLVAQATVMHNDGGMVKTRTLYSDDYVYAKEFILEILKDCESQGIHEIRMPIAPLQSAFVRFDAEKKKEMVNFYKKLGFKQEQDWMIHKK